MSPSRQSQQIFTSFYKKSIFARTYRCHLSIYLLYLRNRPKHIDGDEYSIIEYCTCVIQGMSSVL